MLCIMLMIFIVIGIYTDYKTECSSHHAENTFLCMRQNLRGPTPSMTVMDDSQGTRNVKKVRIEYAEVSSFLKMTKLGFSAPEELIQRLQH